MKYRAVRGHEMHKAVDSLGRVRVEDGYFVCLHCKGEGRTENKVCPECKGTGLLLRKQ